MNVHRSRVPASLITLLQPQRNEMRDLLRTGGYAGMEIAAGALPPRTALDQGLATVTDDPRSYRYGVPHLVVLEDRFIVGTIGGKGLLPTEEEVEIGYNIAKSCRHRGIATAAIGIFQSLAGQDAIRLLAHVQPSNEASKRALTSNGFAVEGLIRLPDDILLERWTWSPDEH